jgi:lactoylglutathione lyase
MDQDVLEMRLVVTAPDYEAAIAFYRDTLGMREIAAFTSPGAQVAILDAGRATLELADPPHAAYVDEVEVGRRVAPGLRVATRCRMPPPRPSDPSRPARSSSPLLSRRPGAP